MSFGNFLDNMRQNNGLGMSNLMNAIRNTSRNRMHTGYGTTPNMLTSHANTVQTNTIPNSPFINSSISNTSTIHGNSVPSINSNMSHYPVQNDDGRYGGMNRYDFLRNYNSGSLPIQQIRNNPYGGGLRPTTQADLDQFKTGIKSPGDYGYRGDGQFYFRRTDAGIAAKANYMNDKTSMYDEFPSYEQWVNDNNHIEFDEYGRPIN